MDVRQITLEGFMWVTSDHLKILSGSNKNYRNYCVDIFAFRIRADPLTAVSGKPYEL